MNESSNNQFDQAADQKKKQQFSRSRQLSLTTIILSLLALVWVIFINGFLIEANIPLTTPLTLQLQQGVGYLSGNHLYLIGNNGAVSVSAPGYKTQHYPINKTSPAHILIELIPLPAQLSVQSTQTNTKTQWLIDQQLIHVGTQLEQTLDAGEYELTINDPFYQQYQRRIELKKGETQQLTIELSNISGKIFIDSSPTGAKVKINNDHLGETPAVFSGQGGKYQLSLQKSGYEPVQEIIELTTKHPEQKRRYQLQAEAGILNLNITPKQGSLIINGQQYPLSDQLRLPALIEQQISYQQPGYRDYNTRITLQPGQQQTLNIQLENTVGDVNISSSIKAEIFIDNQLIGVTPLSLKLPTKPHQLTLKRIGYRTVEQQIMTKANQKTQITIELLTEYEARRKEGKPTVAKNLGIEMAYFRPNGVMIGSPRNEKDRRRDEFQYSVNFTKNFYTSRHEITEAQFAQFQGKESSSRLPVSNITWLQAAQFCNWLSEQEGLLPFYQIKNNRYIGHNNNNGYRLPTEAEWEWLAKKYKRAAETSFTWGSRETLPKEIGNLADESLRGIQTFYFKNYNDRYQKKAPVGSFKADRAGLYDLVGNVSEWVHDYYTNKQPTDSLVLDSLGPARGQNHFYKGSNYESGRLKELRNAYRQPFTDSADTLGFRIARYQ